MTPFLCTAHGDGPIGPCGRPAVRAFLSPRGGWLYRCSDCPAAGSDSGPWLEITLDEAAVLEVMSA